MEQKKKNLQELLKMGLSKKTVSLMTESEIKLLFEKINKKKESKEAVVTTKTVLDRTIAADVKLANYCLQNPGDAKCKNIEIKEAEQTTKKVTKLQPNDQLPPKTTVQQAKAMVNKPELTKTTDTDKNYDPSKAKGPNDIADEAELAENKKKSKKYNPWAICTSSVGRKDKKKYEDCVMNVKQNIKEGKNPYEFIIESKMEEIVETHLSPRITKSELMKIIQEKKMMMKKPIGKMMTMKGETMESETAPAREKEKTKEKEKTRPSHPGKNPSPGEQPAPKAMEDKKDKIIKFIEKILNQN
jgi:hypothetical protein